MKVLPFDLDVTTTQRAKGEKVEYITPGAYECKITGITTTDKPSTQEWKKKQMKEFLINAGVKDFSDDSKAMNSAIGNSLMVTFISEEYIGVNRDTQEPVIREATKYRWSAKIGGKCSYNNDMNQQLNEEQMSEFSMKHSEWTKANNAVSSAVENDDDMPF